MNPDRHHERTDRLETGEELVEAGAVLRRLHAGVPADRDQASFEHGLGAGGQPLADAPPPAPIEHGPTLEPVDAVPRRGCKSLDEPLQPLPRVLQRVGHAGLDDGQVGAERLHLRRIAVEGGPGGLAEVDQ